MMKDITVHMEACNHQRLLIEQSLFLFFSRTVGGEQTVGVLWASEAETSVSQTAD